MNTMGSMTEKNETCKIKSASYFAMTAVYGDLTGSAVSRPSVFPVPFAPLKRGRERCYTSSIVMKSNQVRV